MRQLSFAVALAAAFGTAQAQQWAQRPSDEEFELHYPSEARRAGIEGVVILTCILGEDGRLWACIPTSEEPAGHGFAAAQQLSRLYRVDASVLAGLNGQRGILEVEINFPRRD